MQPKFYKKKKIKLSDISFNLLNLNIFKKSIFKL